MLVDLEQLRRASEFIATLSKRVESNPTVSRRRLLLGTLAFLLLNGCKSPSSKDSEYTVFFDEPNEYGRLQVLQQGGIDTGTLIYDLNPNALSRNEAIQTDIVKPPFRARFVIDSRPNPGLAMQVAVGLTTEARTKINALPRIDSADLTQPHQFQLSWRNWTFERALWDGEVIKNFNQQNLRRLSTQS